MILNLRVSVERNRKWDGKIFTSQQSLSCSATISCSTEKQISAGLIAFWICSMSITKGFQRDDGQSVLICRTALQSPFNGDVCAQWSKPHSQIYGWSVANVRHQRLQHMHIEFEFAFPQADFFVCITTPWLALERHLLLHHSLMLLPPYIGNKYGRARYCKTFSIHTCISSQNLDSISCCWLHCDYAYRITFLCVGLKILANHSWTLLFFYSWFNGRRH